MAFGVTFKLEGFQDVMRRMRSLQKKARGRLLRKAVTAASRLILRAAKAKVSRRTGLLRKSLGIKVKTYRRSGVVVGVIGPRSGFKRQVTLPDGSQELENPTVIAHLVEKGRRAVAVKTKKVLATGKTIFGRQVRAVPARPFMRPAFDSNKAAAEALIRDTIRQGLEEK